MRLALPLQTLLYRWQHFINNKLTCKRSPDGGSDDGGDSLELGVVGLVAFELEDFIVAACCCCCCGRGRRSSRRFSSSSSAAPALFLGPRGSSVLFLVLLPRRARESGEGLSSGGGVFVLRRRSQSRKSILRLFLVLSLSLKMLGEQPPGLPGVEQARAAAQAVAADERRASCAAAARARGPRAGGGRAERLHRLSSFFGL